MDTPLQKIDSLEEYMRLYPHDYSTRMANYYGLHGHPHYATCFQWSKTYPVEGADPDNESDGVNEHNFWRAREVRRFNEGVYKTVQFALIFRNNTAAVNKAMKLWYHFPHMALGNPELVAFTPNQDYGMRDRQVSMKIGKYLQRFFGDELSAEEIRDIANNGKGREIQWAETAEEFKWVYLNGPNSCMVSGFCHGVDTHPTEAYTYQYPDGTPEFRLAYFKSGGRVTARSLCSVKHKVFVRHYGDDGPILESCLTEAGYSRVSGMGSYGLRLKKIEENGITVMPYLDGDDQYVQDCGNFFEWTSDGISADNADGTLGESIEYTSCGECGDQYEEDDMNGTYLGNSICACCRDEYYIYAYYGMHNDQSYVHCDDVVYVGDYAYRDNSQVLDWHGIVLAEDDEYYLRDDCFRDIDGNYYHTDDLDSDWIELHNGIYAKRDDVTNEWCCRWGGSEYRIYHPDDPPHDVRLERKFVDDFGDERSVWENNPAYISPGEAYRLNASAAEDICDHIEDLADELDESGEEKAEVSSNYFPLSPVILGKSLTAVIIDEIGAMP